MRRLPSSRARSLYRGGRFLSDASAHGLRDGSKKLYGHFHPQSQNLEVFCTVECDSQQVLLCLARAEDDGFEIPVNTAALRIFALKAASRGVISVVA